MNRRHVHSVCLLCGAAGLLSVGFIHGIENRGWLHVSLGLVGIAWASILAMPYAMLAGALPPAKFGVYMSIFNFFIVLPEIAAALCFDKLMGHVLHNNQVSAVMIGGGFCSSPRSSCNSSGKRRRPRNNWNALWKKKACCPP